MDSVTLARDVPLCALSDLEERQTIELLVEERQLFAVRLDNQIHAYWNSCPHRGIPLNWMPNQFLDGDGELIQCASHGALFEIDGGRCIAGPCQGDSLTPVAVHFDHDQYFVTAGQPLPPAPINLRAQALAELE